MKPSAKRLLANATMTGRQLARLAHIFLACHYMGATPDLITLKEAIELLPRNNGKKINRSTIQRWIDKGQLETVKIGGLRYVSRSKLLPENMEVQSERKPEPPPIATTATINRKAASLKAQAKAAMDRLKLLRAKR